MNNVEQVIVPSPEAGTWTVRMRGAAVNQGTQGFAAVASGEVRVTRGPLRYAGHAIQDDAPLGNGDGIADPGETIVMPVTLQNTSAATATGITARLRARPPAPATVTGATASWPDIAPSASSPSHAPHLRATIATDAACGTRLSFDLDYASAAGNGTSGFGVEIRKKSVSTAAAGLPVTIPKNSSNGISATLAVAKRVCRTTHTMRGETAR